MNLSIPQSNLYRVSLDTPSVLKKICGFINANLKYHGDKQSKVNQDEIKNIVTENGDTILLAIRYKDTTNPGIYLVITQDPVYSQNIPEYTFTKTRNSNFEIVICTIFNTVNMDSVNNAPVVLIKQYIEYARGYLLTIKSLFPDTYREIRNHYYQTFINLVSKYYDPIMIVYASLRNIVNQDTIDLPNYPHYPYYKISHVHYPNRPFTMTNKYTISDTPVELPKEYNSELLEFIKYQNLAINTHPHSLILRKLIPAFPTMKTPFYSINVDDTPLGYLSIIHLSVVKTAIIDCILFKDIRDFYNLPDTLSEMLKNKHLMAMALKRWARAKNINRVEYGTIFPTPQLTNAKEDNYLNQIRHQKYSELFGLNESQYRYALHLK
jgi:hypothetical protein